MNGYIASVDIGATKTTVSIIDREGIIARIYQRTMLAGDEETIPDQVRSLIETALIKAGLDKDQSIAVGISTAGPFQRIDGKLYLVSPNICGGLAPERGILPNDWSSVPLERELEKHYRSLDIENDAVAGAMAERIFGTGKGYENILYVTWSTGIGTGAIVNDRVIKGKNGNAPHGGHIYMREEGPRCGCGNIGDLEAIVSGSAMARSYGGKPDTAEVFRAYYQGDERAKNVVDYAATVFARGLASMNCILDTELIIIGGSVFLNNSDLLLPKLREVFYRSFPVLSRDVIITGSELGEYLGDLAGLSIVIPDDWIDEWIGNRPWTKAPETIYLDDDRDP